MRTLLIRFALICFALTASVGLPAAAQNLRDYMLMDVCVDGSGSAIAGSPLTCSQRRDLQPGEALTYSAGDYPRVDDKRCFAKEGYLRRYSFQWRPEGVDLPSEGLLALVVDRGGREFERCEAGCVCKGPVDDARFETWESTSDRVTLATITQGFGFLFGYYDPTHGLTLALGSSCRETSSRSLEGLSPTWVVSGVQLPTARRWQVGDFENHTPLHSMREPECGRFRTSFIAWTLDEFGFGPSGQLRLNALVSEKYSGSGGGSPGDARQVERTYWTRELGLARWEKWDRADNVRRDGKDVLEKARLIRRQGVCGRPYGPATRVSDRLRYEALRDDDEVYAREQTHRDEHGKTVRTTWYMVDCDDWTNVRARAPHKPDEIFSKGSTFTEMRKALR